MSGKAPAPTHRLTRSPTHSAASATGALHTDAQDGLQSVRTSGNGSADLQSAVSPICNRRTVLMPSPLGFSRRLRVENPRYSRLQICATGTAALPTVVYPADSSVRAHPGTAMSPDASGLQMGQWSGSARRSARAAVVGTPDVVLGPNRPAWRTPARAERRALPAGIHLASIAVAGCARP